MIRIFLDPTWADLLANRHPVLLPKWVLVVKLVVSVL